ncbi:MAG TPA: heavy-metal-associated domain-containing protein [Candidatus Blautia pullicola]|uniref:Heavy-metal-associated domain-containing protein n=1 Tax=Candidatus Blautia pullicola TaxID=2838498 RepID=A0A9D2FPT4_9FIRM|nr:heavy-metal-associated domain-containing protein [Candidatus Blautia pullicola]
MVDAVILILVLIVFIFAIKGTVKHFKGEGPCCGGGSKGLVKEEDKRLENPKLGEKVIQISGMHCEHCKQSVTLALNKIDGVSAKVEVKKNRAVVSYDRPVEDVALKQAVEKAGFAVLSVR